MRGLDFTAERAREEASGALFEKEAGGGGERRLLIRQSLQVTRVRGRAQMSALALHSHLFF